MPNQLALYCSQAKGYWFFCSLVIGYCSYCSLYNGILFCSFVPIVFLCWCQTLLIIICPKVPNMGYNVPHLYYCCPSVRGSVRIFTFDMVIPYRTKFSRTKVTNFFAKWWKFCPTKNLVHLTFVRRNIVKNRELVIRTKIQWLVHKNIDSIAHTHHSAHATFICYTRTFQKKFQMEITHKPIYYFIIFFNFQTIVAINCGLLFYVKNIAFLASMDHFTSEISHFDWTPLPPHQCSVFPDISTAKSELTTTQHWFGVSGRA